MLSNFVEFPLWVGGVARDLAHGLGVEALHVLDTQGCVLLRLLVTAHLILILRFFLNKHRSLLILIFVNTLECSKAIACYSNYY